MACGVLHSACSITFVLCCVFACRTASPAELNVKVGLILPKKKLRLVPLLREALCELGVNATMKPIDLSQDKSFSSCRSKEEDCDIILSHCNDLLGAEDHSRNNAARLELLALEAMESESKIPVVDPLHSQRLIANRLRCKLSAADCNSKSRMLML